MSIAHQIQRADAPKGDLAIAKIKMDGGTQSRAQLSQQTIDDYAAVIGEGASFPPVVVFHDGSDYWLADGFHRVRAAQVAGKAKIAADIRQGTRRDAILYSVGANESHGLRRTREDKHRAVLTLLDDAEWSAKPERWIAETAHVSHTFVQNVRAKHLATLPDKPSEREVTRGGTTYTMQTAAIGKSAGAQTEEITTQPVEPQGVEGGAEPVSSTEEITRQENLRAAIGTDSATKEERGNNLYETPDEAVHTILCLEDFAPRVYEPACGRGAIVRVLERSGYHVALSDLVDYGTANADGEAQGVVDFMSTEQADGEYDIVTNPPYGDVLNAFVAHALRVHKPRKMALLLNLNFLAGFDDPDRNFVMEECPPARIYVFKRRLPMMHRDGWDGPEAASRMNTAWFVWERQPDGSYGQQTIISRVDWKDYQPGAAPTAPTDAAVTVGNDLREPVAAERGQIIREGDAPRETDRYGDDASGPDTEFKSDGDAFAAATGKAQLANAAGVEPSPSDIDPQPTSSPEADSQSEASSQTETDKPGATPPPVASGAPFVNPACQTPDTCKFAHKEYSCAACASAAVKASASA